MINSTVLHPRRSRMISFRISEGEYDQLRKIAEVQGIASLSDLARSALHQLISDPNHPSLAPTDARIGELRNRLAGLEVEVRRLGGVLAAECSSTPTQPEAKDTGQEGAQGVGHAQGGAS
jgi:hypothetical protein